MVKQFVGRPAPSFWGHSVWLALAVMAAMLLTASPAKAVVDDGTLQSVDTQTTTSRGRATTNRRTGEISLTVTVNNVGSTSLNGALFLAIDNLTTPTVTVANPDDSSSSGVPLFLLQGAEGSLAPGASLTANVIFQRSGRARFDYDLNVFNVPPDEVDTVAPVVTIDAPLTGSLFSVAGVAVTGTVDDALADVTVNGVPAVVSGGGVATFAVQFDLREGRQTLTVRAVDAAGNVGTASTVVTLDTEPPQLLVETPPDGAVLTSLQVDVAGFVNDVVVGTTINEDDCDITVNGVPAAISNRSWVVEDLLLQRGSNVITVIATDRAGNSRTRTTTVEVRDQAGQRIVLLAGNNQSALATETLPDPLVVTLLDAEGDPVPNSPVTFDVSRGGGTLDAFPLGGRSVTVNTNDQGLAEVMFAVGSRAGVGSHRVTASAPGFVGMVEFCAVAETRPVVQITSVDGNDQTGAAEQPLPEPFVALLTDAGGNPVANVDVDFIVEDGGGSIGGAQSVTRTSDSDGLVAVTLTLGAQEGNDNNVVTAIVANDVIDPVSFIASSRAADPDSPTSFVGVVLDNQDNPIPGATITIRSDSEIQNPLPTAITDESGQFSFASVPVGHIHVIADGRTTSRPGVWPIVEFETDTVAGNVNELGMPIWLLELNDNEIIIQNGGPPEELKITLPNVPGAELTIAANSVICPNGRSECGVSWSQVRSERVPMEAPMGSSFMLALTLQTPGVHFDPPVAICIPNSEMPPGAQIEMFSFDHDQGEFVAIGTATVTPDGGQLCSDPGFGLTKSGWHGCTPPPPPKRCKISCDDQNECTNDSVQNPPCSCSRTPNDGASCGGDMPGKNNCKEPGTCMGGACMAENKPDESTCDDDQFCTEMDKCTGGECKGTKVEDKTLSNDTLSLDGLNNIGQAINEFLAFLGESSRIPEFSGSLGLERKEVCCEEKMQMGTLEETGSGSFGLNGFSFGPRRITAPPYSGDYTVTIFGRSIGVAYGLEFGLSGSMTAQLSRSKRECQDDICWAGSLGVGISGSAALFGEVPNPALGNNCGPDDMPRPCAVVRVSGTTTTGISAKATVNCEKFSADFGHDGIVVAAEFRVGEGTFLELALSRQFELLSPGRIGIFEFSLPQ